MVFCVFVIMLFYVQVMIITALCAIPQVTVSTNKPGIPVHNDYNCYNYLKNNYYNYYYMSVVAYKSYYYAYNSTYQYRVQLGRAVAETGAWQSGDDPLQRVE